MCVLCGESVMHIHWTDRRHGNREDVPRNRSGENQRVRMRERWNRIRLANKILGHYGLKLGDWSGSQYILTDKKGRSEMVRDLGNLWPAVEELLGYSIDPLDPALIRAFISLQSETARDQ